MTETENMKTALTKARDLIAANRLVLGEYSGVREVMDVEKAIDTALNKPEFVAQWSSACGQYYAHKRELLAIVTPTDSGFAWRVTLGNGSQMHNFRYGTAENLETAKLLAEAALKEVK